ncbi:MAG: hypothetical protein EXR87_02800 [Gammaproteobacteria bacterium]|nr:hypothetical protein [Gammaproteobacteria bacterium]
MRHFILLLAALLTTSALAIDPPKPQAPPPATIVSPPVAERPDIADDAKEVAAKETAAKAEAEARAVDDEVLPPLPADMVPAGPPPARFNPTEKVRADFPVSFPIDI